MENLHPFLDGHARHTPPTLVLMHSTAGSDLQGAVETLREKGLSYHYIIERDGKITKCVPADSVAYHAGSSYGPREQARGISRKQDAAANFVAHTSVNDYSFGISFVHLNDGKQQITPAQIVAAEQLVGELKQAYPSLEHVSTHAIVSPGRKTDPHPFDLDGFAKEVGLKAWRPG